ncbi:hypothetical protein THAOC_19094 [Thalassiosira oceanica]|uniref:Uncharacterized protein n=1 Tax=Thalassiosira oceanica TaxID=159749 RepID=K0SHP5_THAOC|nr:hypothetical protein THAOC_19094 [Thalassiosira oceanica]|eukprot:EJK60531.1 hypothetical protein THAOC_19094 [Thalassiosira oceanica]
MQHKPDFLKSTLSIKEGVSAIGAQLIQSIFTCDRCIRRRQAYVCSGQMAWHCAGGHRVPFILGYTVQLNVSGRLSISYR